MTTTRLRAGQASEQLTRALITLASQGQRPRCGDYETSYLWLSEIDHERKQAALMCTGCVVITECDEVGRFQRLGAFGGRDTTIRPGKKLRP